VRYRTFGERTGLRVSELALGTGTFGTRWGYGAEPDEARRIFERFAEAGGNFLDCADAYQFGQAETLLGELVAADRDHFVIATKYTLGSEPDGGVSRTGNGRKKGSFAAECGIVR
jgi:aryl-alcohol dehydrogenase-like predicted oxidoreductase